MTPAEVLARYLFEVPDGTEPSVVQTQVGEEMVAALEAAGFEVVSPMTKIPVSIHCAGGCGSTVRGDVPTSHDLLALASARAAAARAGWTSTVTRILDYCPHCTPERGQS